AHPWKSSQNGTRSECNEERRNRDEDGPDHEGDDQQGPCAGRGQHLMHDRRNREAEAPGSGGRGHVQGRRTRRVPQPKLLVDVATGEYGSTNSPGREPRNDNRVDDDGSIVQGGETEADDRVDGTEEKG